MLRRNLLYTGITRARKLVVLVGQRRALAIAVKETRAEGRWSKLNQWLCFAAPQQQTVAPRGLEMPNSQMEKPLRPS
jgi:hypothetical protein